MSTYLNIQFQRRVNGTWFDSGCPVYYQGALREAFNSNGLHNFPTEKKGFPEDFETQLNVENTWDQSWYTTSEIENFVDIARDELQKRIQDRDNANTYEIFKGITKDKSYDDLCLDNFNAEEDYALCNYEALFGLLTTMKNLMNMYGDKEEDFRIVIWFD